MPSGCNGPADVCTASDYGWQNVLEQIGRIAREHDDAICAALNVHERLQLNALLGRIAE